MEIISVQSRVSWGYVGNTMAVPVANAMAATIWPVDTVSLSFHPGHGASDRQVTPPDVLHRRIVDIYGKAEKPMALLIGYLGSAEQGEAALTAWTALGNPGPVLIDPACGDDPGGQYVDDAIVSFFTDVAPPRATVMTPNRFELTAVTGVDVDGFDNAIQACERLRHHGPDIVIATSIPGAGNQLATICDAGGEITVRESDPVPTALKGTGDCLAAAFAAGYVNGLSAADAATKAVDVTETCIKDAVSQGLAYLDPNTLRSL